ncbi:hypothetical protein FIA58_009145 [Flavobacterium jejuense]|uniref:DUF5872 domain-containing protein n=1 Tax=Flavobacterium jejuense TaxID=1544455 RepID=A0ABX0IQ64_9FLAO|nr:hypothetical protein [Flavobacterium jejuense]NHN25838.1 hypothetical protein [Flavobacterium jejuense]
MANPLDMVANSVNKTVGSLLGTKSTSKKKKTVRKPTKAQMKKYVYPMLKKAKKTAYKQGKKSSSYSRQRPVLIKRSMY